MVQHRVGVKVRVVRAHRRLVVLHRLPQQRVPLKVGDPLADALLPATAVGAVSTYVCSAAWAARPRRRRVMGARALWRPRRWGRTT